MNLTLETLALAIGLALAGNIHAAEPSQPISAATQNCLTGSGGSFLPVLSADGRQVAFLSYAKNLVTNDDRSLCFDVFVRDLLGGKTVLASVSTSGTGGGDADAFGAVISSNGQWVAFASAASNLVPGDTNDASDVFVRDLEAGTTTLASVDLAGGSPVNPFSRTTSPLSVSPLISADGRRVLFESRATHLVALSDTNGQTDLFLRDRPSGTTLLVSVNTSGTAAGNGKSWEASFTPDGRYVAFVSTGTDLVPGVTNRLGEIYVRDLQAGQTLWASTNASGYFPAATSYRCFHPAISEDGRWVVFKAAGVAANEVRVIHHDLLTGLSTVLTSNSWMNSWPRLSGDGHLVAYEHLTHVYVWDRENASNVLISVAADGTNMASAPAHSPVMTPDGQKVLFLSCASNLVVDVTNGVWQLYMRDLLSNTTALVSQGFTGQPATQDLDLFPPVLSRDGRWVAFETTDDTLVPNDLNLVQDVLVRDVDRATTRLASERDPDLASGTGVALSAVEISGLSADGTRVAFTSVDGCLAPGDTNGWQDAFLRDWLTDATIALSLDTNGTFTSSHLYARGVALSANGNAVCFLWDSWPLDSSGDLHSPGNVFWGDLVSGILLPVNVDLAGSNVDYVYAPAISPDGRCVIYSCDSYVPYLVPGSSGGGFPADNVFIRDMLAGTNGLVSMDLSGAGLKNQTDRATNLTFSPDGRWVLFYGVGADLTTNNVALVVSLYARDLVAQTTVLVSVGPAGQPNWGYASSGGFSADSRHVVFVATNGSVMVRDLASATSTVITTNGAAPSLSADGGCVAYLAVEGLQARTNVMVRNLSSGTTSLASVGSDGGAANGDSTTPLLSADGRYVVFESKASNLVANDTNRASDIFVRDRWLGATLLASVNLSGTGPGNGASSNPTMAANGRTVVFQSFASDLVAGDYNDRRDVFLLQLGGADTDADGLDDAWELAYFESLIRDGTGDLDQDGATDFAEFRAGTDPTNRGSALQVLSVTSPGSGATTVLWSAVPGLTYRVQFKNTVDEDGWTDVPGLVTAASTTGVAVDRSAFQQGQRFYRVLLEP